MTRSWGWLAIAAACGGGQGTPPAAAPVAPAADAKAATPAAGADDIAGAFTAFGYGQGEATIQARGAAYALHWAYGESRTSRGIGIRDGDRLAVAYSRGEPSGELAVGVYRLVGDELRGRWTQTGQEDALGEERGTRAGGDAYVVNGIGPRGAPYEGTLYLDDYGDALRIWFVQGDERTRDGIALQSGDLIVAAWGDGVTGAADYRIDAGGDVLAGRWTVKGEGSIAHETLQRRGTGKPAPEPRDGPPSEDELRAYRASLAERAELGLALREANARARNDCAVAADTVEQFLSDGGNDRRERLRAARELEELYRYHDWAATAQAVGTDGLDSLAAAKVRCATSARYKDALIALQRASLSPEEQAWVRIEGAITCYEKKLRDPLARERAIDAYVRGEGADRVTHDAARPLMTGSSAVSTVLARDIAGCDTRVLPMPQ
jgi:hypothetical protein